MKRIRFRRNRQRRRIRRRPINVLASAVTIAGLYFGIASIFHAIDQNYKDAAYFILLAMLCDILDGTVAKITHSVSEFGKELDSLCDLVSFGAAPAVLIYTAYLAEERAGGSLMARTGAVFAIIFVICGALRLAAGLLFVEDGDGLKCLSFEHFQACAAAGGDVADLVCEAELFDGGRAVPAADDACRVRVGDRAHNASAIKRAWEAS